MMAPLTPRAIAAALIALSFVVSRGSAPPAEASCREGEASRQAAEDREEAGLLQASARQKRAEDPVPRDTAGHPKQNSGKSKPVCPGTGCVQVCSEIGAVGAAFRCSDNTGIGCECENGESRVEYTGLKWEGAWCMRD